VPDDHVASRAMPAPITSGRPSALSTLAPPSLPSNSRGRRPAPTARSSRRCGTSSAQIACICPSSAASRPPGSTRLCGRAFTTHMQRWDLPSYDRSSRATARHGRRCSLESLTWMRTSRRWTASGRCTRRWMSVSRRSFTTGRTTAAKSAPPSRASASLHPRSTSGRLLARAGASGPFPLPAR
jgi:hypothetical protein